MTGGPGGKTAEERDADVLEFQGGAVRDAPPPAGSVPPSRAAP